MTNPVFIVDIFAAIAALVNTDVIAQLQAYQPSIQAINYQYGHKMELLETLIQMDKNPNTQGAFKYPLIWLVTDFVESRGLQPGVYARTKLRIYIIHSSSNTYKATERKAKVFAPVLYPIYYSLISKLAKSPYILQASADMIPHDKWDRYYAGRAKIGGNDANMLNDYVDAIEIENLDLRINYQFICP